jgi:hypothetical protein
MTHLHPEIVQDQVNRSPEPLPQHPVGKRLCEIFSYPWKAILAAMPQEVTQKTEWKTMSYPLRPRSLWRHYQEPTTLVGVRFRKETRYALLDIDAESVYLSSDAIAEIKAALESIGICRSILLRSSWSGGIHLYLPLPNPVSTWKLALAIKGCLEAHNFLVAPGQLEIFPNTKAYAKSGTFTEYNAHRLPLQPDTGSYLLNYDLEVIPGNLKRFLMQWDIACVGQDVESLTSAMTIARSRHKAKRFRRGAAVEDWRKDLEATISEGWTAHGQTNHLLKTIGCYGVVFEGLKGSTLADYIQRIAIGSSGYEQWCRHQAEISERCRAWARATETYYWALGDSPKRMGNIHRADGANNVVSFNQQRSLDAQGRIKAAVATLESEGQLPMGVTARSKAIVAIAKCSQSTLQKYKSLWHPQRSCVMADEDSVSAVSEGEQKTLPESLEPAQEAELHTSLSMKGVEDCALECELCCAESGGDRSLESWITCKSVTDFHRTIVYSSLPNICDRQIEIEFYFDVGESWKT